MPMNLSTFGAGLLDRFYAWNTACPYPREPKPFCDLLDRVLSMTTPSTLQLLNYAVSCMEGNECYLEVGTWRGGTLAGSPMGHTARGYAIDNGDVEMSKHSGDKRADRDVWEENMAREGLTSRATYIEGETPSIWDHMPALPPVGVFFYDGDKRTADAAITGIGGALTFLAP